MTIELILIIYLLGIVPAYLVVRADFKRVCGQWTVGDRRFGFGMSLLSWFTVLIGVIKKALEDWLNAPESDRKANW